MYLNIASIIQYIDKEQIIQILNKYITPNIKSDNNIHTNIIEWDYHCIRRSVYYNYALFEIFKYNRNNNVFNKSQVKHVLNLITKLDVIKKNPKEFYQYLKENKDDLNEIPLCNLSNNKYLEYCDKLQKIIFNIQKKYKLNNLSIGELAPLESTILIYILDIYKKKQNI